MRYTEALSSTLYAHKRQNKNAPQYLRLVSPKTLLFSAFNCVAWALAYNLPIPGPNPFTLVGFYGLLFFNTQN